MPSQNSHLSTAVDNRLLALFLLEDERSLAWSVTVACYCGLHLVEAAFAANGEHCDDHRQRNERLKNERSLQNLWRHYRPLYDASLRARYLTTDEGRWSGGALRFPRLPSATLTGRKRLAWGSGSDMGCSRGCRPLSPSPILDIGIDSKTADLCGATSPLQGEGSQCDW